MFVLVPFGKQCPAVTMYFLLSLSVLIVHPDVQLLANDWR